MTTLARDEPLTGAEAARQTGGSVTAALASTAPVTGAVSTEERLAEVAPMVRRMCVARLGPWDGEDAAQEVLLRLWQLQQRPDHVDAPLFGWAATNVRWQVLRTARESSRRAVPAGELADRLWVDPQAGPEEQAERRAAARAAEAQMRELLPRLSRRERQVVVASRFGTRSNVETAARLGISQRAVAVAKQNAIARMRELTGVTASGTRAERRAARYRDSPEHRAAVARREQQQAALTAAAEQLHQADPAGAVEQPAPEAAAGVSRYRPGRAGWPQEVHQAGRAAVRDGWSAEELARELGVGQEMAKVWRRANTADATDAGAAGERVPTSELIARARRALVEAERRRAEVDAYARVFGAPRGRGPVPDVVTEKAREAARRGWTPAELERGFALNRATAKRWIEQETRVRDEPRADNETSAADAPDRSGRAEVPRPDTSQRDEQRSEEQLARARRAVAALPSPEQARAAVDQREQVQRAPAELADALDNDLTDQDAEDEHGAEDSRGDRDSDHVVSAA